MAATGAPGRGEIAVDVAIVGAGPAGLTAGYLLAKAGRRVAIIEKDPACVGGLSRTVEHQGLRFDIGEQAFASPNQDVDDLWNELLPSGLVERARRRRIYFEGKLYSWPPRASEVLRNLGVLRSAACLASQLRARLFPAREARTCADWGASRFGGKLHTAFFKPFVEKLSGMPCEALTADWAVEAFRPLPEISKPPRLGAGTMWQAARDRIVERGGIVLMGHALKQLASDGRGGWRMTATGPHGEVVICAGDAISSAPMRELAARLYPLPMSTIEASRLKYRDFLTVALMIKSEDLFPDNWIYIHDSKVQVGRVQNFRSWSPEMVPDADVACVGLEYFCFEGDGLWSMRDDKLVELARREMDILGLVSPDKVIGGAVVRQEKAYPVYDEAYAANVDAMRHELEDKHPTLHLVGRNGMHRYNNQDHAMMTAMLTVENILAGTRLYDTWCVNEDAEYHEAGDEGAERTLPARQPVSEDQAAALASVREVPQRVAASDRKAA